MEETADKKKGKMPTKKILGLVFRVVWVSLLTIIISYSSQIIYNYNRYSSFFVNGASMYPTLNANVEYEGAYKLSEDKGKWGDYNHNGVYYCDYGLMDDKPGFLDKLRRFDIAVTYYPADYMGAEKTLKNNAYLKIKRVIGLPGETVYFNEEGDLYVNGEFVEQTFQMNHKEHTIYKNAGSKIDCGIRTNTIDKPVTLGEGEYFLVGDNRDFNASSDCRFKEIGPINASCIQGRAVAISATCRYEVNSSTTTSSIIWNTMKMPWDIIRL